MQTPLHLAASQGHARCIEILLDCCADMSAKNSQKLTAYDLAKGKLNCERVFQHALTKFEMPQRTSEQQERAKGMRWEEGVSCGGEDRSWMIGWLGGNFLALKFNIIGGRS